MEKRIGVVAILVYEKTGITQLNNILTKFSEIILSRQGLPLRDRGVNVISLIVEGSNDEIGAFTGQIGRLSGVEVKSMLTRHKESEDENK